MSQIENVYFSNLEHNNVNLALNIINEEINKKYNTRITFGSRHERALDSFDNFPSVLRGLAELSRFFQTRTNAKSFSVKIRRQNTQGTRGETSVRSYMASHPLKSI